MANSFDSDILDRLECCICIDMCQIPVWKCENGHNICKSHLSQMDAYACPLCRVSYLESGERNKEAEKQIVEYKKSKIENLFKSRAFTLKGGFRRHEPRSCKKSPSIPPQPVPAPYVIRSEPFSTNQEICDVFAPRDRRRGPMEANMHGIMENEVGIREMEQNESRPVQKGGGRKQHQQEQHQSRMDRRLTPKEPKQKKKIVFL